MADIFISYRRDDSRADAGRIYDRLKVRFGDDHVFMDIDDIAPGEDFVDVLERTLESCNVLLVLIGESWLEGEEKPRGSRLKNRGDFVRLEIEKALERNIRVIPLLVGGAEMPESTRLPTSLRALTQRQAFEVSDSRFHQDVDHLIAVLEAFEEGQGPVVRRWRRHLVAGALAALVVALLVVVASRRPDELALRSHPQQVDADAAKAELVRLDLYEPRWNAGSAGVANGFEVRVHRDTVVVADTRTGLMWQHGGSGTPMRHRRAEEYVAQLNTGNHAGFSDWRLPTLPEVMSLVHRSVRTGSALDPIFDRTTIPFTWTSDRAGKVGHWVVYFADGECHPESDEFNAWVRAVRGMR